MKVLMVEYYLPDSIYSLELGKELKKYCELSIFCREDAKADEKGIRWFREFYPGGKGKVAAVFAYGSTLRKLAGIIRREHFDVVHVQTFKNPGFEIPFYCSIRKEFGKLVHTVHNVLPHETNERDLKLFKKFYDLCDELIVHNKVSRDCLIKIFHVSEEKISVIAHGAYTTYMTDTETEKKSEIKEFLQFGFIRKYKGIDILLDAVALLEPDIRRRVHITIAGKQYPKLDGSDYQTMIKERKLEESVSFIKRHISDEELPAMFEKADFLLFPYRHIYGSGALLMAYTYKKPVIVSNIPAFVEETDDGRTGLIFESENPQALAEAICQAVALGENERKQYQAAICELAAEKYNWEKSALDTVTVYKK